MSILDTHDRYDEFSMNLVELENLIRAAFLTAVLERMEVIAAPDYDELTVFLYDLYDTWLREEFLNANQKPFHKYAMNHLEQKYGTEM